MKYFLLVLSLFMVGISTFGQISYENGYIVDSNGKQFNCLIKNIDWRNNPSKISYKINEDGNILEGTLNTVNEFGFEDGEKYIKAIVDIDKSTNTANDLTKDRNPVFVRDSIFLNVLVDGKASLYYYRNENLATFFYKVDSQQIQQLVYKQYISNRNNIVDNNFYRQQLLQDLVCPEIDYKQLSILRYLQKDLVKLFSQYNECTGSNESTIVFQKEKPAFNVSLSGGLNYSNLYVNMLTTRNRNTDFGNKLSYRFGIEAEVILPFNKNKWGVIFEPSIVEYKSKVERSVDFIIYDILHSEVEYHSIELPLGMRHYFFLNEDSKMYINAVFIYDISFNTHMEFTRDDGYSLNSFDQFISVGNFAFGLGYNYKDKLSLELRRQSSRNIISNHLAWNSKYKTTSLILRYNLF